MKKFELVGMDIGKPKVWGLTILSGEGHRIMAGGEDIWGVSDEFHFAFFHHQGDFDFCVRLCSMGMPDRYSKAGIMARESRAADSKHIYLMSFADNSPRNRNNGGVEFQYRRTTGGESQAIYPCDYNVDPPLFPVNFPNTWLRLTRKGHQFDGHAGIDGKTWKPYCNFEMSLDSEILLGVAVTAHHPKEAVFCDFADVQLVT